MSDAAQNFLAQLRPEDTIDTFFYKLRHTKGLHKSETRNILYQFAKDHEAKLSPKDLIARHQEMRNQINSIRYCSTTEFSSDSSSLKELNVPAKKLHTFKMQDNKLFLSTNTLKPDSNITDFLLHSYTSDYEIEYIHHDDMRRGTHTGFRGKPKYFPIEHVLRIAMLAEPLRDLGQEDIELNNVWNKQFWVLNNRVERNGASVIACVTMGFRVLCFDPQKGYSLVSDETLYDIDQDSNQLIESDTKLMHLITDHKEVIPGLWLPKEVITTWTKGESDRLRRRISYSDMKVNEEIPSSEFDDVIPEGVLVIDFTSRNGKTVSGGECNSCRPPKRAKPLVSEGFEEFGQQN